MLTIEVPWTIVSVNQQASFIADKVKETITSKARISISR